jgi:mitogen-activated protein kinase organizer 1
MRFGPAAAPGLAAPDEHLPTAEAAVLTGHSGPVLAVRFNTQGTYCLSCGKASFALYLMGNMCSLRPSNPAFYFLLPPAFPRLFIKTLFSVFPYLEQDRTIRLWNPHRSTAIKTYVGHGYDVRDATVSQDNSK